MKKLLILLVMMLSIILGGCSSKPVDNKVIEEKVHMFCSECGYEGEPTKFCSECGKEGNWKLTLEEDDSAVEEAIPENSNANSVEVHSDSIESSNDTQAVQNQELREQYKANCYTCGNEISVDEATEFFGSCASCNKCKGCGFIPSFSYEIINGYCNPCINSQTEEEALDTIICPSCGFNSGETYQGFLYMYSDGKCPSCNHQVL